MPRNLLIAFVFSLPLAGVLLVPVNAQPRPEAYILEGAAVFPEGVAFDQGENTFYVSSTTDGAIYMGEVSSEETEIFLAGGVDGRTSATGMTADDAGRLYISGGGTGKGFVYDTASGELLFDFATTRTPTFINDVAIAGGSAFFTDSMSPVLYRVYEDESGWHFEEWLDFTGTVFEYVPGQFNANGIASSPDGAYLIIVQSNTGELFRVDVATKEVAQIDLGEGVAVTAGDGIELRGRTLYVVRNSLELVSKVQLSGDLLSGSLVSETTDESFGFPTTAAIANGRLLVVNSQFNNRGGTPELPFTVSSIPVP